LSGIIIAESSTGEATFIEIKFANFLIGYTANSMYTIHLLQGMMGYTANSTYARTVRSIAYRNVGEFYFNISSLTSWAFSYYYL